MINLTEFEKLVVLYCKNHKLTGISDELKLIDGFEILYSRSFYYDIEDPNCNKLQFKYHMFRIMYQIYVKIHQYDDEYLHDNIEDIFEKTFFRNPFGNDYAEPVDRALIKLRDLISNTTVVNEDKTQRFSLTLDNPSLIEKRE
jgi:hypothetical protein